MPDAGDVARMERIVARARARGVKVIWVRGAKQRGATFPVVPNASFVHHDASSSKSGTWGAIGIITYGRGGDYPVSGPLSQFQVARGSIPQVSVVACGIANHAGTGGPLKGLPQNNANRETYGMEVANNGVGEKYSDATLYAIQVVQASILEEIDEPVGKCIGHKEWSDRKIDPTYSMNWMRDLISKVMQGEDDDMPDEKTFKKWVRSAFLSARIPNPPGWSKGNASIKTWFQYRVARVGQVKKVDKKAEITHSMLRKALELLADRKNVTPEKFRAILQDETLDIRFIGNFEDDAPAEGDPIDEGEPKDEE